MDSAAVPSPQTLVVAGRSARLMAEAAANDGYRVVALDTYGDVDTRRVAARWLPIGTPGRPIDPQRTLDALSSLRDEPGLVGWVAGSDFECEPELLAEAAGRLPLIGTDPAAVARLRDPQHFFDSLDALGLPHPPVQCDVPPHPQGWLRKLARGSGGWHIRRAEQRPVADPARGAYFQREVPGRPMSALFVGNGRQARRVGINEQIVRPLGPLPYVYRGAIGPVALPAERLAALDDALEQLTARFALRGLASLDFLLTDDGWSLLEINPRPSGSLALYSSLWPLMRAHVRACLHDQLPPLADHAPGAVRGTEILFARSALELGAAQAAELAARGDCHDLPAAGSRFAPGDAVCTLSASGHSADAVRERLAAARRALRAQFTDPSLASPGTLPPSESSR
ncbi:MAG TPA: ATP-grasp domain-containing protein [Methylibium sp.]|nr:ATP-grasp domain-containing protein [Methylibium sp.]